MGHCFAEATPIKAFALISSLVFGGLGLWCLWQFAPTGEQLPALFQSQADTLKYILLYGSVVWLKVQALNSRSLNRLSDWVIGQGRAAQRLWISLCWGIGWAQVSIWRALVCSALWCMPSNINNSSVRTSCAIVRGFSVATAWSPVFASIIVILATFPTLTWFDIAPPSFLLALGLFILGGMLLGRSDGVTDAFRSTRAHTPATNRHPGKRVDGDQTCLPQNLSFYPCAAVCQFICLRPDGDCSGDVGAGRGSAGFRTAVVVHT